MDLAPDITAEDIEVFLQETDEQLQSLDEDIVRLEQEKDNPDLLQEIFRISHTLKGSAAMFGHQQMTDLAHAMENLFDQVRKGTIEVSTQVIDALLHSLDILQVLKADLANSEDSEVDIAPAVSELEDATAGAQSVSGYEEAALESTLTLDQTATQRMQTAEIAGQSIFRVQVDLVPGTPWAAIRCFQVLQGLSLLGEIITSQPSAADIEAEKVGSAIQVILATEHDADTVKNPMTVLEDVVNVAVDTFNPDDAETDDTPVNDAAPVSEDTPANDDTAGSNEAGIDSTARRTSNQTQTVRIDVERLDHLMNTIGELVIDRTRILQISKLLESKYKEDDLIQSLGETSAHVVKVVDELQEDIMKARMLPIGTVFSGFPRLVRDLAQKINKKVEFTIEGQDTEIDRTVIERIRDPLVHLLRNAIDHGIQSPKERKAAGKDET
ncbi:MAG: chemotaxis protein CheA, partial [Dehalococcoidia bacterium]